jgi:hypothetical protein
MSRTTSSNYRRNKALIDKFRKELEEMLEDAAGVEKIILDKVGNKAVRRLKENTPVDTGFMRKSWRSAPAVKNKANEVTKTIVNTADYAEYVNYGHRIVNKKGETVGFVKGHYKLEKALGQAEKELVQAFEEEIRRITKAHDK